MSAVRVAAARELMKRAEDRETFLEHWRRPR